MISRPNELSRLTALLKNNPVVAILGAPQVGKTTLAKDLQKQWKQPCHTLRRFWTMLAHYHGQIWNASEFARNFGANHTTIRHYLDILTSAFVVRQLQAWHENLKKRQVKSPKVYLADTGLLHTLLGITSKTDLDSHPKLGASWEGLVISQVTRLRAVRPHECFFWATHTGAEIDLLVVRGSKRWGVDVKRTSFPTITPSMKSALEDLNPQRIFVVHGGSHSFDMDKKIRDAAFSRLLDELKPW